MASGGRTTSGAGRGAGADSPIRREAGREDALSNLQRLSSRPQYTEQTGFRFPPTPPRARRRRQTSASISSFEAYVPARMENTPRSSVDMTNRLRDLRLDTLAMLEGGSGAIPQVRFHECNVLFVVNGGTPQHRGFKNFAHQLLLRRKLAHPTAPATTKMIFWNEAFNQYVLQEVSAVDGQIKSEVADVGSVWDLTRLEPVQRQADLIIVFTNRSGAALSQRFLLGIERAGLQLTPHIVVMANENPHKPTPREAFASALQYTNLPNVAVLYQVTPAFDSLGWCHILHIDGNLQYLRRRGKFDGRNLNRMIEWMDLPDLELGVSLERLVLNGIPGSVMSAVDSPLEQSPPIQEDPEEVVAAPSERVATRIRRISELFAAPTPGSEPVISRLQQELRTEHRRNSRMGMSMGSMSMRGSANGSIGSWITGLPSNRPLSILEEPSLQPALSNFGGSFRGECQLCCEEDSQLVFLLKQSGKSIPQQFHVQWPLAVGSDPENDIISAFMCCDNCSFYVVEQGRTPLREPATGAFSLIPYTTNADRWKEDLYKGFHHYGRLSRDLLPLIFLSLVDETLRAKSWARLDGSEENEQRRDALLWTKREIVANVHMSGDGHDGYIGEWIYACVTAPARGFNSIVYRYPLRGFLFMLRFADEIHPHADAEPLGKVLWARILIEVTRHFRSLLEVSPEAFETVTGMAVAINEALLGDALKEGDWLQHAAAEGAFPEQDLNTLKAAKDEMRWVTDNCRYAMVMWLSYMPSIQGFGESTDAVVTALMEIAGAEFVIGAPEEVGREWCEELVRET
ncbi:hypothetical protein BZA05DRAFT_472115 [Tricharina praecox]|uniref:uncharacterized protein n=1 Tax=Tricharina praecox TaxID=43433 RepID=UPI00221EBBB2|nr:uncharacterized protein BZA05DRAFT_472115 [Tricharina praecox]KAI5855216.1 hypothetical protein BZA05DRAFT_472115 [Tricharina praecox]